MDQNKITENKSNTSDSVLTVNIGDNTYAFPVSEVEAVVNIRPSSISPVPFDLTGRILGVFSHRGMVTALARCKGLEVNTALAEKDELTAVILKDNSMRFALLVDKATAVTAKDGVKDINLLSTRNLYYGGRDENN